MGMKVELGPVTPGQLSALLPLLLLLFTVITFFTHDDGAALAGVDRTDPVDRHRRRRTHAREGRGRAAPGGPEGGLKSDQTRMGLPARADAQPARAPGALAA